ncbi:MAG: hypothetical protein IPG71_01025 [bacterium]|nr:hypothetical protein [bacterium]
MQATITREIALDLIPVYLAGEASTQTKALVEAYARTDPYVKRLLDAGESFQLPTTSTPITPDIDMETLKHTRSRVSRQVWQLSIAIGCSLLAISFGWSGTFLAIGFWIFYFVNRERVQDFFTKS